MLDNIESYIFDLREHYHFEIDENLENYLIEKYSPQKSTYFDEEIRQSVLEDIQFYLSAVYKERERELSEDFERLKSQLWSLQEQHKRAMSLIDKLGLTKFLSCLDTEGNLPADFDPFHSPSLYNPFS